MIAQVTCCRSTMNKQGTSAYKSVYQRCNFKLILLVVILFGIVVPLFIQITLLLHQAPNFREEDYLESRKILYEDLEVKRGKIDALEDHLKELNDIKLKALIFLNQLDQKRSNLLDQVTEKTTQRDALVTDIKARNRELQKLKNYKDVKSQKVVTNVVYVGKPKQTSGSSSIQNDMLDQNHSHNGCTINTCFDFSRCSLIKDFRYHVAGNKDSPFYKFLIQETDEYTTEIDQACISIHIVKVTSDRSIKHFFQKHNTSKSNEILILEPDTKQNVKTFCELFTNKLGDAGNVILTTPWLCKGYRSQYDFILPPHMPLVQEQVWKGMPTVVPVRRRYLLTFAQMFLPTIDNMKEERYFEKELLELNGEEDVYIKTKCKVSLQVCTAGWCSCQENMKLLLSSKFTVVLADRTNAMLFTNLIDVLKSGSVPVIVGDAGLLPFFDTLDWRKASILLPFQRLPELLFMLRSLPIEDLISLKKQGRFIYETYFSTKYTIFRTMISNLKARMGLPPTPYKDVKAVRIKIMGDSNTPAYVPKVPHSLSYTGQSRDHKWNSYPGALNMVPTDPWTQPPPSEYQFIDEGKDFFMPIGDGKGGDGVAFARSLGGDFPVEQFTILMLTYDRDAILLEALQRLSGLKYLHKIVVVWNNPVDPSETLAWPDVGAEIEVIRTGKNSLNNRFIPYDVIETEAILSMDDDIYLRHDEIEFAFRVWRENRDRLVGFPGRHHAYNASSTYFDYNSEHSCELSLVLTGGAFFHKYYSYLYTYSMENSIRNIVDQYMNCEDIAMNFLVAHVTKKPPIKVTSRWTFRCPGCPVALSADADHYRERNVCMKYFQHVYGYNPLKRTQFRADSILFKTRIPSTMTKCFQYV